ncbi:MAG TPA: response regulator transcription factor [Tahibacter sp.]|uniref:response regulator transcription factor n=1 Tax=Tahibacter sp. TaxID=2056211 RepID=UPI002CF287AC|nr:response regulator transcription factor [Tahibacter sp.]HSX62951.1 response regulator transcription factor [Tahibacter sp.]
MSARIPVILVDDHSVVREGLRAVLEEEGDLDVVADFANARDAIAAVAALRPRVAVLDLKMPDSDPVQNIRGLRAAWPALEILVFTSFAEDSLVRDVLAAGATGYLLKDALSSDLVAAVRQVAAGVPWLHSTVQRQLVARLRAPGDDGVALTARELSVLRLIAQGLSNKAIARELSLTEGTVKGYVSQILQKMGINDRTQAAMIAVRKGLVRP